MLTQCLNADIREKLMQPLTAFLAATRALRFCQFKDIALAVGKWPVNVIDR